MKTNLLNPPEEQHLVPSKLTSKKKTPSKRERSAFLRAIFLKLKKEDVV